RDPRRAGARNRSRGGRPMSRVNRWISVTLAAVWFIAIAPSAALAQTVTRGPYLQTGTPTSVVVRWRTDVATNSRVCHATAPVNQTPPDLACIDDPALTINHEVPLSGLSPDTTYFYAVGTTTKTLAGGGADHFVLTAPTPGTPKPTRVWVLGDSGTANASPAAVRDAYFNCTGTRHTDVWLMLGDNAYNGGTDAEYQPQIGMPGAGEVEVGVADRGRAGIGRLRVTQNPNTGLFWRARRGRGEDEVTGVVAG